MIGRAFAGTLAALLLLPLLLLLLLSLTRQWTYPTLLPNQFQSNLWRQALRGGSDLGTALIRSLVMAGTVSLLATVVGFLTSRSVGRHRRRSLLLALAHLPFAASPIVFGTSLLYLFLRLHLAEHALGVILAQLVFAYGYAVILLSSFWNLEVEALEGLAETLGADFAQVWWRVLVPRATPLLAICLFQTFLISWFDYPLTLMIGGGQVQTLTLALFEYFSSGDFRLASVSALLLMAPPLLALSLDGRLLLSRLLSKGEEQRD